MHSIRKVLAWAPAGEGLRRVAVLVGFASVLLWAVELIGQAGIHGVVAVYVAIGLLLAPLVWLLTWLAAQTVFGTLAWVVRGFLPRR